jgi:hypothetical protein
MSRERRRPPERGPRSRPALGCRVARDVHLSPALGGEATRSSRPSTPSGAASRRTAAIAPRTWNRGSRAATDGFFALKPDRRSTLIHRHAVRRLVDRCLVRPDHLSRGPNGRCFRFRASKAPVCGGFCLSRRLGRSRRHTTPFATVSRVTATGRGPLGLRLGLCPTSVARSRSFRDPAFRQEVPDLQVFPAMARPGLEPGTPRFSVVCSTN